MGVRALGVPQSPESAAGSGAGRSLELASLTGEHRRPGRADSAAGAPRGAQLRTRAAVSVTWTGHGARQQL